MTAKEAVQYAHDRPRTPSGILTKNGFILAHQDLQEFIDGGELDDYECKDSSIHKVKDFLDGSPWESAQLPLGSYILIIKPGYASYLVPYES